MWRLRIPDSELPCYSPLECAQQSRNRLSLGFRGFGFRGFGIFFRDKGGCQTLRAPHCGGSARNNVTATTAKSRLPKPHNTPRKS